MKKLLIPMTLALALLLSACGSATAQPSASPDSGVAVDETIAPEVQGDIAIEEAPEDTMPELNESYIAHKVTVTDPYLDLLVTVIDPEGDKDAPENQEHFLLSYQTLVYDAQGQLKTIEDLEAGMTVTVYVNSYLPAPLSLPAEYQAKLIVIEDPEAAPPVSHDLDTFLYVDGNLLSAGNTLQLNMSDQVPIYDTQGQELLPDTLANKDLLVFYSAATFSLPPQTTPSMVIVLGENQNFNEALGLTDQAQ